MVSQFNIRVYALIFNTPKNAVLVSDEYVLDTYMTKFPGGGLNYGEGTIDCLKREAIEEFGQEIEVQEHVYTTDYFQPALFFENQQLISIYYKARFVNAPAFKISTKAFDFAKVNGSQSFRWVQLNDLKPELFTFPIDQKVAALICSPFF